MNTKAMISLDELVNKPELIIKKLEKYSELVLIWNNVPYCVVSKVSSSDDEEDETSLDLVAEEKPLPVSSFFTEKPKEEPARQEYASSDAWFPGAYIEPTPIVTESQTEPVPEPEESAPIEEPEPIEEEEELPFNPYLPLNRDKPRTPAKPASASDSSTASSSTASQSNVSFVPDNEPTLDDVLASEDLQGSYKFDYIPYQVLKKQHANLWDVMAQVLSEHPDHTMHAVDLARVINERGLYQTRDGKGVTPIQIRARVGHRPERFEALGGNMIRLIGR